MRMCQEHWDKLKEALRERGLMGLVPQGGEAAAKLLSEGRPDPLMAAHNAIVGNAMDAFGIAIMMPNEDGSERCPLCYCKRQCFDNPCPGNCGRPDCSPESNAAKFETWIERAADDQLTRGGKA